MSLKLGERNSSNLLNTTTTFDESPHATKLDISDHTQTSKVTKPMPSGLPSIDGYKFLSKGMKCEYPTPHDNLDRALEKCNNHEDVCKAIHVRFCDNRLYEQSYSTCSTAPVPDTSGNGCIFIRNGMLLQLSIFIE